MIAEIHGWTKRADGTLWFGVQVVGGDPPELVKDLIGTTWTMEKQPSRSVARRKLVQRKR